MGVTPAGQGPKTMWLSVREGRLVETFKAPKEGAVERINKKGVPVYEVFYKEVTATLVEIEKREHDFGEDLQLKLQDEEGYYNIQMPFSSRYSASFLTSLENINLQQPVTLRPYHFKDAQGKIVAGIYMEQGGKKVEKFYTKEQPKGLPQMVQIKVKGVMTWDSSSRDEFLYERAKAFMAAKPEPLPAAAPANASPLDEDGDLLF